MVRMHANEMQDIQEAPSGEIAAMFGVTCDSGTTFTHGDAYTMTSMHVPDPVISLAVRPKDKTLQDKFSKAIARFVREDPTFRCSFNNETKEMIISGMGELHLDIYLQR